MSRDDANAGLEVVDGPGLGQEGDSRAELGDEHVETAAGGVVELDAAVEAEGGQIGAGRRPRPAGEHEAVARTAAGEGVEGAGELLGDPGVIVAGVGVRVGRERRALGRDDGRDAARTTPAVTTSAASRGGEDGTRAGRDERRGARASARVGATNDETASMSSRAERRARG